MKVGILSDLHFGANKDDDDLLSFQIKSIKYFINKLIERGINTIIISGDVFHSKKDLNNRTYNIVKNEIFNMLRDNGFKIEIVAGNHDYYYTNSSLITSLSKLEEFDNVTIYKNPVIMPMYNNIGFVPYLSNTEEKKEFLDFIKTKCSATKTLIGHFDIQGFAMTKQFVSDNGFDQNIFKDFEMVISGHFHMRQYNNNIKYVGSPYQITWGDVGDVRGMHILDTDTNDLEFIENPEEFYKKIEINQETDLTKLSETLLNFNNKHVKIISENVDISNKLLDNISDSKLDLKTFNLTEKDIDDTTDNDTNDDVKDISDVLELTFHYVDKSSRPNVKVIKKLLQNAYNKVI
jgi:DNA repair exonuclease SbcCD nuclease subunit